MRRMKINLVMVKMWHFLKLWLGRDALFIFNNFTSFDLNISRLFRNLYKLNLIEPSPKNSRLTKKNTDRNILKRIYYFIACQFVPIRLTFNLKLIIFFPLFFTNYNNFSRFVRSNKEK
jgi:hypothetical protein